MGLGIDYSRLNQEQKEAVTADLGPQLVIAGAGTGKTSVLTLRIAYLITEKNIHPSRILGFTFTNKAADEMKERVGKTIGVSIPYLSTFHSMCVKILQQDIHYLNYHNNIKIIDTDDQEVLLKEIFDQLNIEKKSQVIKKIIKTISKVKNKFFDQNDMLNEKNHKYLELVDLNDAQRLVDIYKIYCDRCFKLNYVDFDDLINLTHKLFIEFPEVLEKWQNKFDYILVDEFQDTNKIQYDLISLLATKHQNLFVVGDPDQMIYSFRGAEQWIINNFSQNFKNTKVTILKTNYRSTQPILNTANRLIDANNNNYKKNLTAFNTNDNNLPIYLRGQNPIDEANWIARKIRELLEEGTPANQIAVLFRSNHYSRTIEQSMMRESIPYTILGSKKFYERAEIKDMIAYLKVVNDLDELSFLRIINTPRRAIGPTTFEHVKHYAINNNLFLFEALAEVEKNHLINNTQKKNILNFVNLIKEIRDEMEDLKIHEILELIYKKVNYEAYLLENEKAEDKIDNVYELKRAMKMYVDRHPDDTINDYLNSIALYLNKDGKDSKENVLLMTVHNSKGLEYENVFVAGMNEGLLPSDRAINDDPIKGVEEERRIAYVALTRAKKNLYISSACCYDPLARRQVFESRFINEIGFNNLKIINSSFKNNKPEDMPLKSFLKQQEERSWFDSKQKQKEVEDNFYQTMKNDFEIGERIVHTSFGDGVIIGIDGDILTIAFSKYRQPKQINFNHKTIVRRIG
ncbi:ATP-dependent helicase [Ureaplasma parvum]|uniref:DNA 3'-5' helicase n=3 Tax=Ureaplasma parvum TaxID=134821 RepID=Q9PPY9_UREPA|nr:UvrD-helicase domain-containing protein [Ureaplasma parvum]pir/D82883/ DNA helicase II UU501 [imported] - Ureaplasma urealyticum [Ureaplasma urealyticum]AAF30913.1 DNA helicase II [Ureaplasma parvum serovar 3 str. ATCC 700970]ACA33255.1 ATP-dependent DNA helicase PcrA [Ureaplasma parvum serovar 3 str. ATCC 27815]ASD24737.1 AAA family ATPase [Ureaplasma parvum]ASD24991.1 AAA family ATPase [Ureaplasma parvum]ASD30155.1 AAA family ATPase [Ureaplasma parvum]